MAASALVFVYNADGGVFNSLADLAHKTFSPATYACNLCALTYGTLGMRGEWKEFLRTLNRPVEFLHADELRREQDGAGAELPAVFERDGTGRLSLLIDSEEIEACRTLDELKELVRGRAGKRLS